MLFIALHLSPSIITIKLNHQTLNPNPPPYLRTFPVLKMILTYPCLVAYYLTSCTVSVQGLGWVKCSAEVSVGPGDDDDDKGDELHDIMHYKGCMQY